MNTPTLISKIVMSILIIIFFVFLILGPYIGVGSVVGEHPTWWVIASIIFLWVTNIILMLLFVVKIIYWLWNKD